MILKDLLNKERLATVLEEYAASTPDGNVASVLEDFVRRFPEYRAELVEFAAARAIARYLPEIEPGPEGEERDRMLAAGRLRSVLGRIESAAPIGSLVGTAEKLGIGKQSFAKAAGLSLSLLIYLEKRRIEFATIPAEIVSRLASILQTGAESVAEYLRTPPDAVPQANYKTSGMPGRVVAKSFAEAVREDQTLTAEQKTELLRLTEN